MFAVASNRSDGATGITRVALGDLIALRARAAKPHAQAAHTREAAAGGHVSALHGRGMDYAESRIYQAGDDVRNIDWRRTARSGKWHTKLFQAERERALLLLVDTHATMCFGTRTRYKSVAAARAAAWLAWSAVRAGDRVGALAFGGVRAAVDPHPGTRAALAVSGALAAWDRLDAAQSAEPLSEAIERARRLAMHARQVWLLSDGWCADAAATRALLRLARHADVRVVIVVDPLEAADVPAGNFAFAVGTTARVVDLASAAGRADFQQRLAEGHTRLAAACEHAGVPWATLATTQEPDVALAPLWRLRGRRR
jgi:uncharacterized protein (DUF58 family)